MTLKFGAFGRDYLIDRLKPAHIVCDTWGAEGEGGPAGWSSGRFGGVGTRWVELRAGMRRGRGTAGAARRGGGANTMQRNRARAAGIQQAAMVQKRGRGR